MLLLNLFGTSCKRITTLKRTFSPHTTAFTTTNKNNAEEPMITIWVHGTRMLKTVTQPLDEYIHAAPPNGITPVTQLSKKHRLISIAKTLSASDPNRFSIDTFYVFGWSGDLSFQAREDAAQMLYKKLQALRAEYMRGLFFWRKPPRIRLITHSHGCNVVLNLAKVKDPHDDMIIDETIFLAGPVQKETKDYIYDSCFKKIYSFYSTLDSIQVLDPQGLYKSINNGKRHIQFSERRFPAVQKLRQAKLKINGHGIPHIGFILQSFLKNMPLLLDELDNWYQEEPAQAGEERLLLLKT